MRNKLFFDRKKPNRGIEATTRIGWLRPAINEITAISFGYLRIARDEQYASAIAAGKVIGYLNQIKFWWGRIYNQDFIELCEFAGFDPQRTFEKLKQYDLIKKGIIWNYTQNGKRKFADVKIV